MGHQSRGRRPKKQRACGKQRFRDHQDAIEALRYLRERSVRSVVPARAYECDRCGGWHLTSQDR